MIAWWLNTIRQGTGGMFAYTQKGESRFKTHVCLPTKTRVRYGAGRGESPLIPWMGPRFSPPVVTGTRLGNGRGRGQGPGAGAGNGKIPRPAPGHSAGRGGELGRGPRFSGPRSLRNEH